MAGSPSKPKQSFLKRSWQVVLLLTVLTVLVCLSVVSIMIAMGAINVTPKVTPVGSVLEAQLMCDQAIREEHGDAVQAFNVDDFSSRYENGQYLMFYEVNMYRNKAARAGVDHFYLNCFVSPKGRIRNIELFEDKAFVPKAVKRTSGNAFGI